jgi:hypothetical protein
MSFRPDPTGARTIEQAIEDLTKIVELAPAASPRARKISEMIRGLRKYENERRVSPPTRKN